MRCIYSIRAMAQSRYEYVKTYERETQLLPQCWSVVRLDGHCFTKFCEVHKFEKPNDSRALQLMNSAAEVVMDEFREMCVAYGASDEMSFVFHKDAKSYGGRSFKLVSLVTSCFTGSYVRLWGEHFPEKKLQSVPYFDGRVVQYPSVQLLRDYLAWRQVDTHVNNQYNTCFWGLIQQGGMSPQAAYDELKGTTKGEKNEIMFQRLGINYNNLPEMFRKGSVLYRDAESSAVVVEHVDIIKDHFWETHSYLLK